MQKKEKKTAKLTYIPVLFASSSEDEGRAWNGSADALLRMDKEELGSRGSHSGIPVHFSGATNRALGHSESSAGDSGPGFRALPRAGLPLPCQTFPTCRNGGILSLLPPSSFLVFFMSISQ